MSHMSTSRNYLFPFEKEEGQGEVLRGGCR
jgi:hypothetical protein